MVDLELGGHNGRFPKKGKLLGMGCATGGTMVIIQAALGMECVSMLEHEPVRGEREGRGEQRQEEQRRGRKITKNSAGKRISICMKTAIA